MRAPSYPLAARRRPTAVVGVALMLLCAAARADTDGSWSLSLHFENDLFADTDARYSSGIKITAVSPDLSSAFRDRPELPAWARRLIPAIPFIREGGVTRSLGFSIGQNIYTPEDTARSTLDPDDRPYAGWLYLATTFQTRARNRQDTFEVQLGVVGPESLAEQAQEFVHRARGIEIPRGWDNQLRTEPGLVLAYERVWRTVAIEHHSGAGTDLLVSVGGAVGNVVTYASVGAQLRAGWRMPPDFGYSLIRPGGVTEVDATRDRFATDRTVDGATPNRDGLSFHLFAGIESRAVARDIFLDGNSFRSSHSVDSRPFVADLLAGFTIGYRGLKLSLARVLRTREFDGQPDAHRFGSITLSYAF